MTKTYSEQKQLVLFRASRELRRVACEYLDDVQNEVECANLATLTWAVSNAASTARLARELEDKAEELAISDTRQRNLSYKSHREYERAIDEFEKRVEAVGMGTPLKTARQAVYNAAI